MDCSREALELCIAEVGTSAPKFSFTLETPCGMLSCPVPPTAVVPAGGPVTVVPDGTRASTAAAANGAGRSTNVVAVGSSTSSALVVSNPAAARRDMDKREPVERVPLMVGVALPLLSECSSRRMIGLILLNGLVRSCRFFVCFLCVLVGWGGWVGWLVGLSSYDVVGLVVSLRVVQPKEVSSASIAWPVGHDEDS